MDPDAALAEARAAAAEYEALPNGADEEVAATLIGSALGSYQALDDWLTKGGFPPRAWGPWYTVGPRGLAPPP